MDADCFSPDIREFIVALDSCGVRYVIVGGEAVIYHGHARYTGDVELNGSVILNADLSVVSDFLDGRPHPGKNRERGHFGFAGHRSPVMFRNVVIRKLD